ncbi:ABC transporter permease subunit [Paenibacillus sp. UMB7766-LJ446]|uniref:ABC transporter permease n=1 Tax=Paenibacillus sp. UMB7766-LJ446 TaxID=3046313 RepID=UPI0025503514|nr:ABC transporter permease subunit [Paenibacillus sp. UMB7766-LJ446]MDK8189903.1 ABC transporter permease subunit [Paenibacillus sp. UMB7766-LJ446]
MGAMKRRLWKERQIWIIAIPMLVWVLVFCYYPLYGLIIAFQNYVPGHSLLSGPWVGLDNFIRFFHVPEFKHIIRNTVAISLLTMLLSLPAPIILAVLFNEVKSKLFKRSIQTLSYIPYFISWVVVASIINTILGSDGIVNDILLRLGLIDRAILFMGEGKYFWGILASANLWKEVGFSTIIYLSAIAGIDGEQYEAGRVDGLGRFGLIWHITLPSIRTTIVLLWILGLGNILNAGFEQQLLLGTPMTQDYYEVIDTYVYRYGVQLGNYSFGTAVGLMKAIIGIVLVVTVNKISKKTLDTSIF